jgi:DNA mismatch repair protein MutL
MTTPRSVAVLDDALVNQIAAGEVVERPASLVKELIENAIDAGARTITVDITGGGVERVSVVDDGHGMGRADATLAVQRHATSKLRTREDLDAIRTLGFRGEALPSIASVSRFTLITRTEASLVGTQVTIEGGATPIVTDAGTAVGTRVEVRDLFFNVPARRKFLKSNTTEAAHVAETVIRTAVSQPSLRITLIKDGRIHRELLPAASLFERASSVFPNEPLCTIEASRGNLKVSAALSPPERSRSGTGHLHLLINGRPVRDLALARAIAYAYGSVLPPGRYPVGVVHLHVDPASVDVNVHPQKLEVRFSNARDVLDDVTRVLAKELGTVAWGGLAQRTASYWQDRLAPSPLAAAPPPSVMLLHDRVGPADPPMSQPVALIEPTSGFGAMRVLGQVRQLFLICEGAEGLIVIDQHAADERVRFHRLRTTYRERAVKTQSLLFPERAECNESEVSLVQEHQDALLALGLDCGVLGPTTVAIRAVPALLHRAPPERLLRDVLAELSRGGERAFADAIDMALATMACHGSIRAGDTLSPDECTALLRSMDEVDDFATHCPHGRPVIYSIDFEQLERRLGR